MKSVGLVLRGAATVVAFSAITPAYAQAADPAGSGPIVSAVLWIQNTLLGNIATAAAVIAVAVVGFLMLSGRLNWRFGLTVIVGCFVLFGAATIVGGIRAVTG